MRSTNHARLVVPDVVWAPLTTGVLLLAVGLLALAAKQPWLFPSLGPTAFLQAEYPENRTSQLDHVIVGHLIGLAAGLAAVFLTGATHVPPAGDQAIPAARVAAAAIAVLLTMAVQLPLRVSHPPSAATTLLIALGVFKPTPRDMLGLVAGVVVVAVLGEILRRARLARSPKHARAAALEQQKPSPLDEDA